MAAQLGHMCKAAGLDLTADLFEAACRLVKVERDAVSAAAGVVN